jgi:hypothetical protein
MHSNITLMVSQRAIFARINRKLQPDGLQLRTARSHGTELSVGRYFLMDLSRKSIMRPYVDLGTLTQELGLLNPWEQLDPSVTA